MKLELRPYQHDAVRAIHSEFQSGVGATLLVLPTGCGKTVCFTTIGKQFVQQSNKPILILAHRTELIDQAVSSVYSQGLIPRVEKAGDSAVGRMHNAVVASVQTLSREKRLNGYAPDHFSLIVTDEAHHSPNKTYRTIYKYFGRTPHLGVTATPSRHDEVGLKNVFDTCAYQYSIAEAITDGWLVPVIGKQVEVSGIHLEDVKVVAGEFSQPEMDAMLRDERTLQSMVLPTMELAGTRPTIVFTPGVEHAHEIAACFNRLRPGSAVAVDGGMGDNDRRLAIEAYRKGRVQFIVNVGVLTEGFDHPPTACIALFRPTRSLGLFAQMVGRGTRLAPNKEDCLVLDFVGVENTVRTITVMDVLDGTILSNEEHKKAQQLQKQGVPSMQALAQAKKFVAGLDSVKATMRAISTSNAFDVIQMFEIPSCKGLYGGEKATGPQRSALMNMGLHVPDDLEKGEASRLIDRMIKRREKGLATWKQMRYLRKLGYKDNHIDTLTFKQASDLIDTMAPKNKPWVKAA